MLGRVRTATLLGVEGQPVDVEVHVSNGLPGFTVVGLPDAAVREARDRVRAALLSCGLRWPQRRVTVNLAPSGVRKAGPGLDVAIAVGVLAAQGDVPTEALRGVGMIGELGLDGSVRAVPGTIALTLALGVSTAVVPAATGGEAAMAAGVTVRPVSNLASVVDALRSGVWPTVPAGGPPAAAEADDATAGDLAEVCGQRLGRRALEVAAAGGHHLLLIGPPGCGKTMLATRLPGLLPPLEPQEVAEVARIRSAAGRGTGFDAGLGRAARPPFRAPHHGVTPVAMVGGGPGLRPGEVSLAHRGVLFLDELAELDPVVLASLLEPLEDGRVRLVRARGTAVMPARFQLVAAMNPCPCGEGMVVGACRCTSAVRDRYVRRVTGPLLDRFDMVVVLRRPDPTDLLVPRVTGGEPSGVVAQRVAAARRLAERRGVRVNAELSPGALDQHAPISGAATRLLAERLQSGQLSARGLHRVRRVARTLADLGGIDRIDTDHVAEALVLHDGRALVTGVDR